MAIWIVIIDPEFEHLLSSSCVATCTGGIGATAGFRLLKRRLKLSDTLAIQTLTHTARLTALSNVAPFPQQLLLGLDDREVENIIISDPSPTVISSVYPTSVILHKHVSPSEQQRVSVCGDSCATQLNQAGTCRSGFSEHITDIAGNLQQSDQYGGEIYIHRLYANCFR